MCRIYGSWIRLGRGVVIGVVLITISTVVVPAPIAGEGQLKSLHWAVFFSVATYYLLVSDFFTPVGEEVGFRGYALPRLQNRFGPSWGSVLIGLVWTVWYLPALALVQLLSAAQILMCATSLIAISIVMTLAANLSEFSILVAIILHTLVCAETGYLTRGFTAHTPGLRWDWTCAASNLLVPALIVVLTKGQLGARFKKGSRVLQTE